MTDSKRISPSKRGYNRRWAKARAAYLRAHPLCVYCQKQGVIRPATVVDHKIPHKGNDRLFWDEGNWQALCKPHHDSTKQAEDRRGHQLGADAHGNPLDVQHHWNK